MNQFYVYILSSATRRLYIGMNNNLEHRVYEHKNKLVEGFIAKYNVTRLVYFEYTESSRAAVERERQLKGWLRSKKVQLIAEMNPTWADLSQDWFK